MNTRNILIRISALVGTVVVANAAFGSTLHLEVVLQLFKLKGGISLPGFSS